MVLVLGIVKASLEILGIGIGVKKVVLLRSALQYTVNNIGFATMDIAANLDLATARALTDLPQ